MPHLGSPWAWRKHCFRDDKSPGRTCMECVHLQTELRWNVSWQTLVAHAMKGRHMPPLQVMVRGCWCPDWTRGLVRWQLPLTAMQEGSCKLLLSEIFMDLRDRHITDNLLPEILHLPTLACPRRCQLKFHPSSWTDPLEDWQVNAPTGADETQMCIIPSHSNSTKKKNSSLYLAHQDAYAGSWHNWKFYSISKRIPEGQRAKHMVEKLTPSDPCHFQLSFWVHLSHGSPAAFSCCSSSAEVHPGIARGYLWTSHCFWAELQSQEAIAFSPGVETSSLPQWLLQGKFSEAGQDLESQKLW